MPGTALLLPGFSNCHTHIGSNVLLRGLNEDAKLFEWLASMWRLKQNFDARNPAPGEPCRTRGDGPGRDHQLQRALRCLCREPGNQRRWTDVPLRATLGYGFADIGLYADVRTGPTRRWTAFGDIVAEHHNSMDGRLRVALSPHATYSCTEHSGGAAPRWRRSTT
jgi:5-methylthioadenosine/S-adenosylhomocysteine deaminase